MARLGPVEDTFPYPEVTEELLAEVVRRILAVGDPERIILFGSRARGDARRDSDLDLFIVERTSLPVGQRNRRYGPAVAGLFPDCELVVHTPEEVAARTRSRLSFVSTVLREGRVLYATGG